MEKKDIASFGREELIQEMEALGERAYRGKQIYTWLHEKGADSFEEMTNLSRPLRERLSKEFEIVRMETVERQISKKDPTEKFLFVEVQLLSLIAKGLDKFPGIREMGEHIRTAMNRVLEIALLIGGAMASEQIAPGIGFFWVIGILLLNKKAKKPIVEMAVGPIAAVSLGILVNILNLIGLCIGLTGAILPSLD